MRKFIFIISLASIMIFTVACGTTNNEPTTESPAQESTSNTPSATNNENNQQDSTEQQENVQNQDDMQQKMAELDFIDFELEVEYANDETYEADLDTGDDDQTIDTEIEDDLNGVHLKGEEAFNELYPLVSELSIDQNSSKEEVIANILAVFQLPENYQKFEVEITFKDGPKLEYEDKR